MVTVYTVTYNEELIIEFFINHYRKKFPDCKIVVFDNYSTDRTVEIAKLFGCEIIFYDTNNTFSDKKLIEIKNGCWKDSETEWVIVCDCDELIQINEEQLKKEEKNGYTIFKFNGYNLMNFNNDTLENISYGWPDESYDKILLFNKTQIKEINYNYGCHESNPIGILKVCKVYDMFHYKFLGKSYTINRYKKFAERLSDENIKLKLSWHYFTNEEEINRLYDNNEGFLNKIK
jgi:hypothetical protein